MNTIQAELPKRQAEVQASDAALTGPATTELPAAGAAHDRGWQRAYFVAVCVLVIVLISGPLVIHSKLANDHYVYLTCLPCTPTR